MPYRERVGRNLHQVAVQVLGQGDELRAVQHVLRDEPPVDLCDGQDAVIDKGRLRWAQEVARPILARDEELGGGGGMVEPRGRADIARGAGGRRVREDQLQQAVGEAVAHVRMQILAPNERRHGQEGPDVHADGLGLQLLPPVPHRPEAELLGEERGR